MLIPQVWRLLVRILASSKLVQLLIISDVCSPGTGDLNDIGIGQGKNYAVNVPLKDGIDDETYRSIFKPVSTFY